MEVDYGHGYFPSKAWDHRPCPICGLAGPHKVGDGARNGDRYEEGESKLTRLDPLSGEQRAIDRPFTGDPSDDL